MLGTASVPLLPHQVDNLHACPPRTRLCVRRNLPASLLGYSVIFRVEDERRSPCLRLDLLARLPLPALGFSEPMPVPPPRPRKDVPELTALATKLDPRAFVEIVDHRAYLDLLGCRFDLGHTMRTSRDELERQIAWFSTALASASNASGPA